MSGEVDTISFKVKRHRPSSLNLSNMTLNKLSSDKSKKSDPQSIIKSGEVPPSSANDKTTPKIIDLDQTSTINSVQLEYKEDNSDVALRLVSPGLPRLSDEMKNTIKLSHKIHIQQKHIIEARISGNSKDEINDQSTDENNDAVDISAEIDDNKEQESSDKSVNEESNHNESATTESVKSQTEFKDSNKLNSDLISRGLKRKHVPTPLTIDQTITTPNPATHSAPIFSKLRFNNGKKYQTTPVAKTFNTYLTPHKASPYSHSNKKVRLMSQGHIQYPATSTSPYFSKSKMHYQQFTPQPTAGFNRAYPPLYQQSNYGHNFPQGNINAINDKAKLQESTSQSFNKSAFNPRLEAQLHSLGIPTEARKVVDVFHGDLIKDAPIQSQPLSSQREYFDHTPTNNQKFIEDDRSPVSEEEIREMQEKYASNQSHFSHFMPGMQSVPCALNPMIAPSQPYPAPLFIPRAPMQSQTSDKTNEIFGSIQFMNEKFFNFKIFDDESSDTQRQKFLRLCENTWDEFISKKSTSTSK